MLSLLVVTLSMGILDSFNPVALTQQFCLQGMVKKRRHILFFSCAVGITNLVGGLAIYYGLDQIMARIWSVLEARFFWVIPATELLIGVLAWTYVAYRQMGKKFGNLLDDHIAQSQMAELDECQGKISSVHPAALMSLGAFAVLCEIPTSLPYFAFLTALLQYRLSFPALLGILILYNLLFTMPLFLMYLLYIRCQKKVDRLYRFLQDKLFRYGTVFLPILAAVIGIAAIYHSCYLLFSY